MKGCLASSSRVLHWSRSGARWSMCAAAMKTDHRLKPGVTWPTKHLTAGVMWPTQHLTGVSLAHDKWSLLKTSPTFQLFTVLPCLGLDASQSWSLDLAGQIDDCFALDKTVVMYDDVGRQVGGEDACQRGPGVLKFPSPGPHHGMARWSGAKTRREQSKIAARIWKVIRHQSDRGDYPCLFIP